MSIFSDNRDQLFKPTSAADGVSLGYLNGYLTLSALINEYRDTWVGHEYWIRPFAYYRPSASITDMVRAWLEGGLRELNSRVPKKLRYDDVTFFSLLTNEFRMVQVVNWQQSLSERVKDWFPPKNCFHPLIDCDKSEWSEHFAANGFFDLLMQFFSGTDVTCWTIEGEIRNEMYKLPIGNVCHDDFFYLNAENCYHLHFGFDD